MSDNSPIVACRNLARIYRQGSVETPALRKIDLDFERGGFLALAGPSGSGKTTLLNLIGGLDKPTQGDISLDGVRIETLGQTELAALRLAKIGFVFQAYNLVPVLSARENVEFVMMLQGVGREERRQRATSMLDEVGLENLHDRRPTELSGGQQQRVAVARAIVANPKIVLADEPTANLDSTTGTALLETMREMNRNHGVTFIFSTHDPRVMDCADRIIRLRDGLVCQDGDRY